jgi:hypothetical protein
MKRKVFVCVLATVMVVGLVASAARAATTETGNGGPSGAHYNLNIIGMEKPKNVDPDSLTSDGITQYSVYLRVLGKPGGKIRMATSATDPEVGEVVSDLRVVSVREKGQMKFANVSAELLYIYAWIYDEGVWTYQRVPLFSDLLEGYLWSYDNNGARLVQMRFYEGVPTQAPDPTAVPHLASIEPYSGLVGTSMSVTLTGVNVDFNGPANDQTPTVDFGSGVTVNSVAVTSDLTMVVQISIDAAAGTGWRPVNVTFADRTVMTIWFQVL